MLHEMEVGERLHEKEAAGTRKTKVRHLIDTDIHVSPRYAGEIREYIAEPWRSQSWGPMERGTYLIPNGGARRSDSTPPDGSPGGSDPDFLFKQVFQDPRTHVHYGILLENLGGVPHDPRFNVAYRAAINEWLAATWLGKYNHHGRYKGAISVTPDDPRAAAAEIEKWAGHPHFVQVLLPPTGIDKPYGHPQYDPMWEAASRHGLPISTHVNTAGGIASWGTPAGFQRYWSEQHTVMYPMTYATHLTSLVCDGAFERFPGLRFIFVEGGFQWASSVINRIVRTGRYLGRELGLKNVPTRDFINEHVRFTSQPVEDVPGATNLVAGLELSDAAKTLMFSSDYPHWDGDDPVRAFPNLPPELESRIYLRNAAELYGFNVDGAGAQA